MLYVIQKYAFKKIISQSYLFTNFSTISTLLCSVDCTVVLRIIFIILSIFLLQFDPEYLLPLYTRDQPEIHEVVREWRELFDDHDRKSGRHTLVSGYHSILIKFNALRFSSCKLLMSNSKQT